LNNRDRWIIGAGIAGLLVVLGIWAMVANGPSLNYLIQLYQDRALLKQTLQAWGWLAPGVFIIIQALQVVISPIPGEATGLLGGFLFGLAPGFIYSTFGLTLGTIAAFGAGRWLGIHFVRRLVRAETWDKLGFIVEAEGAVIAFVIYLIPGFPKDIVSYLFGISPMPFWVFALVSTLGRMPGTWVLSAQGAKAAAGRFVELSLILAVAAAIAIPLYYYRGRILGWIRSNHRREKA
jgi:uncharacterized membrane protein YdjX (TVP38/TMEM64 family)